MLTVREPLISNFQALQSAVDPGGVAGTGSTGETRLNRIARQTELRQRRAVVPGRSSNSITRRVFDLVGSIRRSRDG